MAKPIKEPAAVAQQIVTSRLSELTDHVLGGMEDEQFTALLDALLAAHPKDALTLDEDVALYTRLMDALPETLKKDLWRFNE